jgi:hypothetical protein
MKKYFVLFVLTGSVWMFSFNNQKTGKVVSAGPVSAEMYFPADSPAVGITYTTIPRNVDAPFSVFVDKIRQDNKSIGMIHEGKKKNWEDAHFVYEISLPNKTKIAEAAVFSKDAKEVTVWTFRDNKKQKLPMYKGTLEMDMVVVKYLIEKGYL